jgi:transposase
MDRHDKPDRHRESDERKRYPSDLTESEWRLLEPLVPAVKRGGRPARHHRREIVNGVLYIVRTSSQWRAMPHDLPPWQTVYYYFRQWRNTGVWEQMHTALREQTRRHLGREATPSAAILDSQSVKTRQKGGHGAAPPTSR